MSNIVLLKFTLKNKINFIVFFFWKIKIAIKNFNLQILFKIFLKLNINYKFLIERDKLSQLDLIFKYKGNLFKFFFLL